MADTPAPGDGQFGAAKSNIDASKLGALQALAEGGSQAKAAFDAQQAAAASQKAEALKGAMAQAVAFDAPEAGASLEARIARPYDTRGVALGDAANSRAAALKQISAAQGAYMDEVNAAIPIVQARAQEKLAATQAAAAKAAAAEQRATLNDLWNQYGGQAGAKAVVGSQADAQAADFSERRGADGPGSAPRPYAAVAEERAQGLGIPNPAAGAIALELAKQRAADDARANAGAAKDAADPTKDPAYAMAEKEVADSATAGNMDQASFLVAINNIPYLADKPAVKAALISKYGKLFPSTITAK